MANEFTWAVLNLIGPNYLKGFFPNLKGSVSLRIHVGFWRGKIKFVLQHSKTQTKPEPQTPPSSSKQPVSCQHSKTNLKRDYSSNFVSQLFLF